MQTLLTFWKAFCIVVFLQQPFVKGDIHWPSQLSDKLQIQVDQINQENQLVVIDKDQSLINNLDDFIPATYCKSHLSTEPIVFAPCSPLYADCSPDGELSFSVCRKGRVFDPKSRRGCVNSKKCKSQREVTVDFVDDTFCSKAKNGFYSSPYACSRRYTICMGKIAYKGYCKNGYIFTDKDKGCVAKDRKKACASLPEAYTMQELRTFCKRRRDGLYELAPQYYKYAYCAGGIMELKYCPEGKVFSTARGQCVKTRQLLSYQGIYKEKQEDVLSSTQFCIGKANGIYFPDGKCSDEVIFCLDGQASVQMCETSSPTTTDFEEFAETPSPESGEPNRNRFRNRKHRFWDPISCQCRSDSELPQCYDSANAMDSYDHDITLARHMCKSRRDGIHQIGKCKPWFLYCNMDKAEIRQCAYGKVYDHRSPRCVDFHVCLDKDAPVYVTYEQEQQQQQQGNFVPPFSKIKYQDYAIDSTTAAEQQQQTTFIISEGQSGAQQFGDQQTVTSGRDPPEFSHPKPKPKPVIITEELDFSVPNPVSHDNPCDGYSYDFVAAHGCRSYYYLCYKEYPILQVCQQFLHAFDAHAKTCKNMHQIPACAELLQFKGTKTINTVHENNYKRTEYEIYMEQKRQNQLQQNSGTNQIQPVDWKPPKTAITNGGEFQAQPQQPQINGQQHPTQQTSDKGYVYPSNSHGQVYPANNPQGYQFNPCEGGRNGGYFSDPNNCKGFIQCSWGTPNYMPCGPGTGWNQHILTCDHLANLKHCN